MPICSFSILKFGWNIKSPIWVVLELFIISTNFHLSHVWAVIYSHNLVLKSRSYCGPRIVFYGMWLYDCLYFRLGQFITKTLVFVRHINFLQIRNKKKVVLDWHFHFHLFCFFQQTAELMFYHLEFYRFKSILLNLALVLIVVFDFWGKNYSFSE